MLNSTNFQQIIVGNSGFGHPPPEVYVPIIINFIIGILTDPLPPDRDDVTIFAVFLRLPLAIIALYQEEEDYG